MFVEMKRKLYSNIAETMCVCAVAGKIRRARRKEARGCELYSNIAETVCVCAFGRRITTRSSK